MPEDRMWPKVYEIRRIMSLHKQFAKIGPVSFMQALIDCGVERTDLQLEDFRRDRLAWVLDNAQKPWGKSIVRLAEIVAVMED